MLRDPFFVRWLYMLYTVHLVYLQLPFQRWYWAVAISTSRIWALYASSLHWICDSFDQCNCTCQEGPEREPFWGSQYLKKRQRKSTSQCLWLQKTKRSSIPPFWIHRSWLRYCHILLATSRASQIKLRANPGRFLGNFSRNVVRNYSLGLKFSSFCRDHPHVPFTFLGTQQHSPTGA